MIGPRSCWGAPEAMSYKHKLTLGFGWKTKRSYVFYCWYCRRHIRISRKRFWKEKNSWIRKII